MPVNTKSDKFITFVELHNKKADVTNISQRCVQG